MHFLTRIFICEKETQIYNSRFVDIVINSSLPLLPVTEAEIIRVEA